MMHRKVRVANRSQRAGIDHSTRALLEMTTEAQLVAMVKMRVLDGSAYEIEYIEGCVDSATGQSRFCPSNVRIGSYRSPKLRAR
jgi:hypothetical protein